MTDREWRWTRNGRGWRAEVLPDGPEVVRFVQGAVVEWEKMTSTSFNPGDLLIVKYPDGDVMYDVVSSGKGDTATFRIRQR